MINNLIKKDQALIIKVDGTLEYVSPKGKKFNLDELQAMVRMPDYPQDSSLIEIAPVRITGCKALVNEEGLLIGMPLNRFAELALQGHKGELIYAGNVVVVPNNLW
jgi:hypothetical protein